MKLLTLDIEARNEVRDWERPWEAGIACVGVEALWHPAPMLYDEHNLCKLPRLIEQADVVLTHNGTRYDLLVLEWFLGRLGIKCHVDLWMVLRDRLGWSTGPSLEAVARPTLSRGKGGHGLQAIDLWRQKHLAGLHSYCLLDVVLTRMCFMFACKYGFLLVYNKRENKTEVVELSEWKRRPVKTKWQPGFWHKAMGVA